MFVRWKIRPLGQPAYRRDVACAHLEEGREAWTPVVVSAERVADVGPRQKVLWSPVGSIRSCCVFDWSDPIARTQWWGRLRLRCEALCDGRESNPFRQELLAALPDILRDIDARVPSPTELELEIAAAWESIGYDPRHRRVPYRAHRTRLLLSWHKVGSSGAHAEPRPAGRQRARRAEVLVVPEAFRILGLRWPCTRENIKRAWRAGLHRHHPDKGGNQKDFERWMAAYEEAMGFCDARSPPG
jgi:hypothetical protein